MRSTDNLKIGVTIKRYLQPIAPLLLLFLLMIAPVIVNSQTNNPKNSAAQPQNQPAQNPQNPQLPQNPVPETASTEPAAASITEKLAQERLLALPKLRTQLDELRRQNRSDVTIVLNETLFNKIFAELTQTKFNAGGLFEVTIVNPHISFANGIALAHMQAQLGGNTLEVTARLLVEQNEGGDLIAKLQVMELKPLASSDQPAIALLSAQQLTGLLPPLKLPLQLDFDQTFRPATIKQVKPVSYELSAEARRIRGRFEIFELLPLSNRLLLLARIKNLTVTRAASETTRPNQTNSTQPNPAQSNPAQPKPTQRKREKPINKFQNNKFQKAGFTGQPIELQANKLQPVGGQHPPRLQKKEQQTAKEQAAPDQSPDQAPDQAFDSPGALDAEIDRLSTDWRSEKDFAVNIGQRFLSVLTDEIAKASTKDLLIKLFPSRLLTSKSDLGFAKYDNYLDLDGGDGTVDLRDCDVDSIKNGRITVFVDFGGQVQAQAHGKQIGFSYKANPQIGVSMRDQLSFVVEQTGTEYRLRAVSKQTKIHLDINVPVPALGTGVNASQDIPFDPAMVMKPMMLPQIINTSFRLPHSARAVTLVDAGYHAEGGRLQFDANIQLSN